MVDSESTMSGSTVWCEIMVDSESTMSGSPLDPEVAALPPARPPLVLHDPEVLPAFGAVTDGSDRVVVCVLAIRVGRLLAAVGVIEDAVAVVEQVVCVDVCSGGSNRSNVGGHVSLPWIPGDVVAGDAGSGVVAGVVIVAVVVGGGVGAAVLLLQTPTVLADNGLHVPVGPPAFAAVGGEAVDKVLLGKVGDDAGLLGEAGLDGGDGGEGCAAAALPLVLDRGDDAVVSPVPGAGCRSVGARWGGGHVLLRVLRDPQSQLSHPLLLCEVVPLVDPTSPGHTAGSELLVVLHHPVVVLHEDGAALGDLGPGVVLPALLLRPVQEHILAGQARSHQSARQQKEPHCVDC